MNDADTIKAGVELVGWSYTRLGDQRLAVFIPHPEPTPGGELLRIGYLDEQHVKDALAAELVRQVDALEGGAFHCEPNKGIVCGSYEDESHYTIAVAEGPDRTMNTIKAIVDSSILDKQETK